MKVFAVIKNLQVDLFASLKGKAFSHLTTLSCISLGFGLSLTIPSIKPVLAAGVVGNGTASSCTETALDTALAGGGTITFNCGSSPVTIAVSSEKKIATETLIDGKSLITLDGGRRTRIFKVEDNNVSFSVSGLTIANGFTTDQGAGILSGYRSKLTVVNCKFNNNVSVNSGKYSGGGGIYIKSESSATVQKSTFTGNQAGNGGAIHNLLSNLTVTDSTFTTNKSVVSGPNAGGGGAIYVDGANGDNGKIVLSRNRFTSNTAVFQGGAILIQLYNRNTASIQNSTLSSNSVTGTGNQGFGGGVFIVGGVLSGLTGFTGGSNNGQLTVTGTTFYGNTASNQGGALYDYLATVNITNSTITGNKAVSADGKSGLGGGIMRTVGKINITNTTIAYNYAGFQGGGIFGTSGDITLRNTIVANNKANNGGNGWNIKNNCGSGNTSLLMTNGGNNLEYPQRNLSDPTDKNCVSGITVADPKLGSLGNYGGSTQTIPLLSGSAAINAGNNTTCPSTDQRGVARPQGGTCDIGAFEAQ